MLQTRAGRCPHCKEETPSGAEICPACGAPQEWAQQPTAATSEARPAGSGIAFFGRLFALFLCACLLTFLAVTYRTKVANRNEVASLEASHAILVQDAEAFRDQLKAGVTNADMPEATFVIGVALPNGKDVLEVTVKREWLGLDYPERLHLAARLAERWKAVHAPHRANLTILNEAGAEIGGQDWNGTVWVVEKSEEMPPSAVQPRVPAAKEPAPNATPNTPAAGSTPETPHEAEPSANAVTNGATSTASEETPSAEPTPEVSPTPPSPDDLSDIEKQ